MSAPGPRHPIACVLGLRWGRRWCPAWGVSGHQLTQDPGGRIVSILPSRRAPLCCLGQPPSPSAGGARLCRASLRHGHASIWRLPNVTGLAGSRLRSALTRSAPVGNVGPGHRCCDPPWGLQQGVGGLCSCPGCPCWGWGWRGQPAEPPPRQRGHGCYMTRRGRRWAGTHRGCDSCCGYNREPGEGGRDHLRSLRAASTLRGPGARSPRRGTAPTAPPGTAGARRRAGKHTRHPGERLVAGAGTPREGCWCVPYPPAGRERAEEGARRLLASRAGSTGRGNKAGTEGRAKFSPFPC